MFYAIDTELLQLARTARASIVAATNAATTADKPRPEIVPVALGTLNLAYYVLAQLGQIAAEE